MTKDFNSENLGGIVTHPIQRSSLKQRQKRHRDLSPTYSPAAVRFAPYPSRKLRRLSMGARAVPQRKPINLKISRSNQLTPSRTKALHSIRARTPRRLRGKSVQSLSADQLSTLYNTCTKLLAQNRISEKNSWDYNFIEHFNDMLKNKKTWKGASRDSNVKDEFLDFVTAGHLLATSTRFYSCRVDSLAKSTYKVLGGLQTTGIVQKPGDKKQKAKKKVNKNTLESNKKNISMNPNEQLSNIDPLFHKTTTLFDAGGTKDLLLNYLNIDSSGTSILLDGEQKFISAVVEDYNEDTPIPSLHQKEGILQTEILPAIGLFDYSLLGEEEEEDSGSETHAQPRDAFASGFDNDLHDFASVVNVDELPDFGDEEIVDMHIDDLPNKLPFPALPGGGVAGGEDVRSSVSNNLVECPNFVECTPVDSNEPSDIPSLTDQNIEQTNQNWEVEASLLSSIAEGGNWAGNVVSIRNQLNRMRRKKAEALRAIKQLKLEKKENVSKEKKDKFKLDFSPKNISSLPPLEEAYVQMTEKELVMSTLSQVDPTSRYTSTGNPITSEWNLLPNDLYLNVDIWKTLMLSPDFSAIKPLDANIVRQRGYDFIPAEKVHNNKREFNHPNSPIFENEDAFMTENSDIVPPPHSPLTLADQPEFSDLPTDTNEPDMLAMPENDLETSKLNIVKFDHKYAAGQDVVDHAKIKKFTLKPQPRPQDILYLKQSMGRSLAKKKSDSFKQLVGNVLVRLSGKSRSRLNFGSCLLVLLTLANRQSLLIEREDNGVFGDFVVRLESEKPKISAHEVKPEHRRQ